MTDRIGRIAAISEQIVEALVAEDRLVLAERRQQIGKLMLGNSELPDGFGQRDKNRMRRTLAARLRRLQPAIHGAQFFFPAVKQSQSYLCVADLIAEIVGDAAVGVNIEKMLMQSPGKEPARDRKILVVSPRQSRTVSARLGDVGSLRGDAIGCRQTRPALRKQVGEPVLTEPFISQLRPTGVPGELARRRVCSLGVIGSVPGNNCRLDLPVAVQHMPQYLLQP